MALRDIIDMLGTLNTIKRQQEAQTLAEQHERTGAFGEFSKLMPHMVGKEMAPLIRQFSESSGIPEEAFRNMVQNYQPPTADINANVYSQFLEQSAGKSEGANIRREAAYGQATGGGSGAAAISGATADVFGRGLGPEMQRQFTDRTVSGMSSGSLAMDQNLANQPVEVLAAGNRIKLGTQLSAGQREESSNVRGGQVLQGTIAGATLNQGDRRIAQEGNIALLDIQGRADVAGGRQTGINDAQNRYQKNITLISTKHTSDAASGAIIDQMEQDHDYIHGAGSFKRKFGSLEKMKEMRPSRLAQIVGEITGK